MKPRRLLRRVEDTELNRRLNSIKACLAYWNDPDGMDQQDAQGLVREIEAILAGDHR